MSAATASGVEPKPSGFSRVREAFSGASPLDLALIAMVAFGVYLRVQRVGASAQLKWDEHHYVDTARSYLHHRYAWNDHPPLSKLIIMSFMQVLGDRPIAWRLPSLLFGVANFGLLGWLTRIVFGNWRAGCIAGAFVAVDGFFIAYSRTALLDGMIVACSVGAMICVLSGRTVRSVILAGLLAGCAVSFKLNGLVFVAATAGACALSRELRRYTPLLLAIVAVVFYAQCAAALVLVGRPGSLASVIAENKAMVNSHLSYTVVHPFSSKWYTWFLPGNPIHLRHDTDADGAITVLMTLGNPLLWWGSSAAVLGAVQVLVATGPRRLWGLLQEGASRLVGPPSSAAAPEDLTPRAAAFFWVFLAWLGPVAFWFPSLRDSYIYHYLPSYTFALVLLAGFTERLHRFRPWLGLLAVLIVFEVSVFYAPLWGEMPLSRSAFHARLFIKVWR
jgi:dolichyl-phosphate-mannose--protein O-mannosyl transferase